MADSKSVGAYLYSCYEEKYLKRIDELKMHKLMYFSQREFLMFHDIPLFEENFYAWKFGPVLKSVRSEYHKRIPYKDTQILLESDEKKAIDSVLDRYGNLSSWRLSSMSHCEISWLRARTGLKAGENGDVCMELTAIRVDAAREKAIRRDSAI